MPDLQYAHQSLLFTLIIAEGFSLSKHASDALEAAAENEHCQWTEMDGELREKLKDKTKALFRWFSHVRHSDLSDVSFINGSDYESHIKSYPCYVPVESSVVLKRYLMKNSAEFETEFNLDQDQLIVAILDAVWQCDNDVNIDFAPLCSTLQFDLGTYNTIKQLLMNAKECSPKDMIEESFCSPVDCCLGLTMAYCELNQWSLRLDWDDVVYVNDEWTEKELDNLISIVVCSKGLPHYNIVLFDANLIAHVDEHWTRMKNNTANQTSYVREFPSKTRTNNGRKTAKKNEDYTDLKLLKKIIKGYNLSKYSGIYQKLRKNVNQCTNSYEKRRKCAELDKELKGMSTSVDRSLSELRSLLEDINTADMASVRVDADRIRRTAVGILEPEKLRNRLSMQQNRYEMMEEEQRRWMRDLEALGQNNETIREKIRPETESDILPEIGDWVLSSQTRRNNQTEIYQPARIVRIEKQANPILYRIETAHGEEIVAVTDIAVLQYPLYDPRIIRIRFVGLRVMARVKNLENITGWFVGTVAAPPTTVHGYEFLVLFDEGFEAYVNAPFTPSHLYTDLNQAMLSNSTQLVQKACCAVKMFPMARQNAIVRPDGQVDTSTVHHLVPEQYHIRSEMLRIYLIKYPDWPMKKIKKPSIDAAPQILQVYDVFHKIQQCQAVHVDRSMCVVRFPPHSHGLPGMGCLQYPCTQSHHCHQDQWLFRGSPRFLGVNASHTTAESNMSARRIAKNKSRFEYVEPDNRRPDVFNIDAHGRVVSSGVTEKKKDRSTGTARKSTNERVSGATAGSATVYYKPRVDINHLKEKEQTYTVKRVLCEPQVVNVLDYHEVCGPECLVGQDRNPYDKQFIGCSPLRIPLLCGWKRIIYTYEAVVNKNRKRTKKIMYRAPCGRSLCDIGQLTVFLQISKSELTIDMFIFDPLVDPLNVCETPPEYHRLDDFSYGLEHIPLPVINAVDNEPIPQMIYGPTRYPFDDTVDVSTIDKGFCSGCSCAGDCSDFDKCECQQLTKQAWLRLAKSFRPLEYGYQYRLHQQKNQMGIYECNDNCSCNRKRCYNRVVQNPIKYPMQIYKTAKRGWGVRCLVDIPRGAFIANYVGALLHDGRANDLRQGEDIYFADLDLNDVVENAKCEAFEEFGHLDWGFESDEEGEGKKTKLREKPHTVPNDDDGLGSEDSVSDESGGEEEAEPLKRGKSDAVVNEDRQAGQGHEMVHEKQNVADFKWAKYFGEDRMLYVVDAMRKGNVGRFLNHSCDPNVEVQHVFVDTHDLRLPWSSFFAKKNIKAGEELCWSYGYSQPDADRDPDKQVVCDCGAPNCTRERLL